jgi:hypothetical protein
MFSCKIFPKLHIRPPSLILLMIHPRIGEYFPAKAEKWEIRTIITPLPPPPPKKKTRVWARHDGTWAWRYSSTYSKPPRTSSIPQSLQTKASSPSSEVYGEHNPTSPPESTRHQNALEVPKICTFERQKREDSGGCLLNDASNIRITYFCVRVCCLTYPACKAHAPCSTVICRLSGCTVFFQITS